MLTRARTRGGQLGRPKGSSSKETTARILAAARTCFARTGWAATTTREIADEAGVTNAAIYLYFDSKTALYRATVHDAYAELVPIYRAAVAKVRSLPEGFRAVLAASTPLHENDPSLAAFLSALPVEMRRHREIASVVVEEGAQVVQVFEGLVQAGVRAGEIPAAVAPNVLALFVACTMGLSLYVAAIAEQDLGGIIDAFNALIDGTLFKKARGSRRKRS